MNRSVLAVVARRAVTLSAKPTRSQSIASNNCFRFFSASPVDINNNSPVKNTQRPYYHIELSNVARTDVTQIIVTGPGTIGLLASMCVAVASKGGSIKELHAADSYKEGGVSHTYKAPFTCKPIRDIITVVDYKTGQPFPDDQLQELGEALLESTRAPMKVVAAVKHEMNKILLHQDHEYDEGEITVIAKNRFKFL